MNFTFLGVSWVDIIIVFVLAIYGLEGLRRGFIHGWIDVAGFIVSLFAAFRFYPLAAKLLVDYFSLSRGVASAAGFLVVAFLAEFSFFLLSFFIVRFIPKLWTDSKLNTYFGVIPALISGFLLVAFMITTLLSLPVRPNVKQEVVSSKIGGMIAKRTLGLERVVSSVFGGAIQEYLTFLTVKPEGNEIVNLNFKTVEFNPDPETEDKMLFLVNQERVKKGMKVLDADGQMRAVGRAHCEDMFRRGYFSHYSPDGHSPFDRMKDAGVEYLAAGENLAYAPTVEIAHEGLMNSPGHRANILSADFGRLGIGVINAGIYGRMFCQEFRN